mmetsp:Transcript_11816/g.25186  ORF Transcript_11816/g.25186 Transcript_11816/m.25186 type:complete len:258 (+) Transcript_11816:170-943(+)
MMKHIKSPLSVLSLVASSVAFTPMPIGRQCSVSSSTRLNFFEGLDKAFEDSGPLGKGITVGKVQVALAVSGAERTSSDSIFALLEKQARNNEDIGSSYDDDYDEGYGDSHLSKFCHETCLALLRKSDNWVGACSDSEWFKEQEMGKAESKYNLWADREACKFEKEYVPPEGSEPAEGNPTVAVVSLIIEIQGDETNFDRAGFSTADTKSVLTSIASDCRVEGGDCLNAFEVFWTPSEPKEVLTERDIIVDFPELITL